MVAIIVFILGEWINILLVTVLSKCPPHASIYMMYLFTIHRASAM